ncbi:MAG: 50S ribosomal protein L25 [Desulfobacterales bacterium]|nr:50S ribosomal protein L25 [Desulfobacterales bacterium]
MELIDLNTNIRTSRGNSAARVLRSKGQVPAVLYGPGTEPVLLSVSTLALEQVLKKSTAGEVLVNLTIQDGDTANRTAMIREMQTHPVSRKFLHVDFYEIAMDRKLRVGVPILTKGKSKGVELGGILQIVRREIELLCLPLEIPDSIVLDITDLDIGDAIHVQDIPLKEGLELPDDVNFTILTVASPMKEEEPEEEVEEGVELEGEEAEKEESESEDADKE